MYSLPQIDYQQSYGQIAGSLGQAIQGVAMIPEVMEVRKRQKDLTSLKEYAKLGVAQTLLAPGNDKMFSPEDVKAAQSRIDQMNDPEQITETTASYAKQVEQYIQMKKAGGSVAGIKPMFGVDDKWWNEQITNAKKQSARGAINKATQGQTFPSSIEDKVPSDPFAGGQGPVPQEQIAQSQPQIGAMEQYQFNPERTVKPPTVEAAYGAIPENQRTQFDITREGVASESGLPTQEKVLSDYKSKKIADMEETRKTMQTLSSINDESALSHLQTSYSRKKEEATEDVKTLKGILKKIQKANDTPIGQPDLEAITTALKMGIPQEDITEKGITDAIVQNEQNARSFEDSIKAIEEEKKNVVDRMREESGKTAAEAAKARAITSAISQGKGPSGTKTREGVSPTLAGLNRQMTDLLVKQDSGIDVTSQIEETQMLIDKQKEIDKVPNPPPPPQPSGEAKMVVAQVQSSLAKDKVYNKIRDDYQKYGYEVDKYVEWAKSLPNGGITLNKQAVLQQLYAGETIENIIQAVLARAKRASSSTPTPGPTSKPAAFQLPSTPSPVPTSTPGGPTPTPYPVIR